MPTYTLRNKNTGEEFTEFMTITELDPFLVAHPELETVPVLVHIGDPFRLGRVKPTSDFQDRLKEIKKTHRGNTIDKFT